MNFKNPILTDQIITYLGNKRKLLQFIDNTVDKLINEDEVLSKKENKDITFFDIFSGSGVVSRYSKLKGFKTYSNDLEPYSTVIQRSIIGTNKSEVHDIFENSVNSLKLEKTKYFVKNDNYLTVLNYLNSLIKPKKDTNKYWSIHYAPANTQNPDFHNERLFYTQENALKIDAIVEVIENESLFTHKEREIIQTSLMYNMTWHINTSGTMKGFHNGWGGKGGNALERIMGNIVLEPLPFIDGEKGVVFNDYAEKVFSNNDLYEFDVIYADPPYNQHQYSANYNHLNTLLTNEVSSGKVYNPGPVIQGSRAGIRVDHNRSDFCKSTKTEDGSKKLAEQAFIDFINNVSGKYIVMSYNNEGVITIDSLMEIMHQKGKNSISVEYQVHDKFKGGKATKTSNKVMEYLIIIQKNVQQTEEEFDKVKKELLASTKGHLFKDKYIDYTKLIDCNENFLIQNEENNLFINILKNNIKFLTIRKRDYKIMDSNITLLSDEEIECIEKFELDFNELMEIYIENKDKELAQNTLRRFKIKGQSKQQEEYQKRIDEL